MSVGVRIRLAAAFEAVERLRRRLPLDEAELVGSARRGSSDVGDLEFVAPLPAWAVRGGSGVDELYEALDAVCRGGETTLFGGGEPDAAFTAVSGLRPGFRACRLRVKFRGVHAPIPVEFHRYEPGNRGWTTILRTGPREFGIGFLDRWRKKYGIPPGVQASADGYLRDAASRPVETPTEEEAFNLCGLPFYTPEERSQVGWLWSQTRYEWRR